MNYPQEIDYHIELSALKNYANKLIESKVIPINAKHIFDTLKKAVINSEVAPFLKKPTIQETDGYYDKYLRLEEENKSSNMIPDFFNHEGDFYDMDRNLNFSRSYVNDETFKILFSLKLMELHYSKINLKEVIDFQLYDNYNGNKEAYGYFLQQLMAKDSISYLLPSIAKELQQWIKVNEINIDLSENEEDIKIENEDKISETLVDYWETKKNQIIDGKMSIDNGKAGADLDFNGDVRITTNDNNTYILGGKGQIYLNTESDAEPLVRGETLQGLLGELIDAINAQIFKTPSGPTATGPENRGTFNDIKGRLEKFKSTLNFTE